MDARKTHRKCRGTSFECLLKENAPVGHDSLTGLDAGEHKNAAILFETDLHFLPGKLPGLLLDKHIVLFTFQKHRLGGDTRARRFLAGKIHVHKHFRFEEAARVIDSAANLDRARGRVDEFGDGRNAPGEGLPRKGATGKSEITPWPHVRQVKFGRINLNPKL